MTQMSVTTKGKPRLSIENLSIPNGPRLMKKNYSMMSVNNSNEDCVVIEENDETMRTNPPPMNQLQNLHNKFQSFRVVSSNKILEPQDYKGAIGRIVAQ